jgi:hypothetical protein
MRIIVPTERFTVNLPLGNNEKRKLLFLLWSQTFGLICLKYLMDFIAHFFFLVFRYYIPFRLSQAFFFFIIII